MDRTQGRWPLLLVAAGYLVVPGCITLGCTLIGGNDGLIVEVEVTGGMLPGGDYTIVARAEGVELRIDETLSEGGSSASTSETPEALVDGKRLFLDGVVFGQSGTIMVGFREGGGPEEVTIEVRRGDEILGQGTFAPKYTEFRPNGEHCGPELQQAHGSLVLSVPAT